MTNEEFLKFHREFIEKMHLINQKKNADYCGANEDAFDNFKNVERLGICNAETGFLCRMMDKVNRIKSFVKQGTYQVHSESVQDTLMDLCNYSLMLAAYMKSKEDAK